MLAFFFVKEVVIEELGISIFIFMKKDFYFLLLTPSTINIFMLYSWFMIIIFYFNRLYIFITEKHKWLVKKFNFIEIS